jgi:hypothetical protein
MEFVKVIILGQVKLVDFSRERNAVKHSFSFSPRLILRLRISRKNNI